MTNQNQPSEVKEGGALALLPCPFCGAGAAFGIVDDPGHVSDQGQFVACSECDAQLGLRYSCGDDAKPILAQDWNRRPPSMERGEAEGWRHPDDLPDVKPGQNAYRIVAVKRAHNGKVARFAAFYLNAEPLWFEDENESRPVTGWNADREGDDGPLYEPLLSEGDELMGWREFPAWEPAAPSPAPSVSPDEIKAAYMRGWNDRESDIIERAERILPAPSAVEMAGVDREALAQIIAPNIHWTIEGALAHCEKVSQVFHRSPEDQRAAAEEAFDYWESDREKALAAADRVLFALATASREKGAES